MYQCQATRFAMRTFENILTVLDQHPYSYWRMYHRLDGLQRKACPDFIESDVLISVLQIAIVPDFHQPFRKYMLIKPSQEFLTAQCHFFRPTVVGIILVLKSNTLIAHFQDPVVGDRYFLTVPTQIFHNLGRSPKRSLRINIPSRFFRSPLKFPAA